MKTTWLNDNIKPILAICIVTVSFAYFFMCSIRNLKPDPQILIAFVTSVGVVIGYFFGSSSGSTKKDEIISQKPTVTQTGTDAVTNVVTPNEPTA